MEAKNGTKEERREHDTRIEEITESDRSEKETEETGSEKGDSKEKIKYLYLPFEEGEETGEPYGDVSPSGWADGQTM